MTSWMWPWASCSSRRASSASTRSRIGLADPDQDPRGEGDTQLAGATDHRQARRRALVGGVLVGAARAAEPLGDRLEHHPLAGRDLAQLRELAAAEDAGVGVGQEAGLLEHHRGTWRPDRTGWTRGRSAAAPPVALEARLGAVAEGEQGLLAAQLAAGLGDREHLVGAHGVGPRVVVGVGEGAVGADVPAEVGQRDEDLARVGDQRRPARGRAGPRRRPRGRGARPRGRRRAPAPGRCSGAGPRARPRRDARRAGRRAPSAP